MDIWRVAGPPHQIGRRDDLFDLALAHPDKCLIDCLRSLVTANQDLHRRGGIFIGIQHFPRSVACRFKKHDVLSGFGVRAMTFLQHGILKTRR